MKKIISYIQFKIAGCYKEGIIVRPDFKKALKYYIKSARNGNDQAKDHCWLA
jgi:TPR repeat protein